MVMTDWQPIETAPKDGTAILAWPIWGGGFYSPEGETQIAYVMRWEERKSIWVEASGEEYMQCSPTHWMPLPPAPKKGGE